ncbi:Heat shock protein 78, mitochondrial [Gigaspora margarita]|uniref:Heat shock protein 78, mitochondrial n=1 Tax=Gigaspora margarita TaxID=4874 RepID=A0A8H4AAU2_GIGMA|nr:Heat shock protein 78, mitochondrial [Gigaspora margarita]
MKKEVNSQRQFDILDDGHVTDSQDRKIINIDFRNTIIIMISNLGVDILVASDIAEEGKIVFNRLSRRDIVDIRFREIQKRLENRHVTFDMNEHAKAWLAEKGGERLRPSLWRTPDNLKVKHSK